MRSMPGNVQREARPQAAMEQEVPPETRFTAHKSTSNTHEQLFAAHQIIFLQIISVDCVLIGLQTF